VPRLYKNLKKKNNMPNIKSAKKELRKTAKRKIFNKRIEDNVKALAKKNAKQIVANDPKAKEDIKATIKAIDKAVQKGIIKRNNGSRKISRLQKKVNKIK
jgi:small subunit ribosomal protein S20